MKRLTFTREQVAAALHKTGGNVAAAARLVCMSVSGFRKYVVYYELQHLQPTDSSPMNDTRKHAHAAVARHGSIDTAARALHISPMTFRAMLYDRTHDEELPL